MLLNVTIIIVTVALVLVTLLLILLVLMQRPKQEGLGAAFGAGVTDQIWGSQTTNVLQKGTVYMGVLLFVLSLTLAMLKAAKARENTGLGHLKGDKAPIVEKAAPAEATPASTVSQPISLPEAGTTITPATTPAINVSPLTESPAGESTTPAGSTAPSLNVPSLTDDPAPEGTAPATPPPADNGAPAPAETTPAAPAAETAPARP
jgi:preprotein translocase subunit SecG